MQHWKQKLEETGNFSTKPQSGRPSNEMMKEKVANFVKENDETARVCMTSQSSVHRHPKEENVKLSNIHLSIGRRSRQKG